MYLNPAPGSPPHPLAAQQTEQRGLHKEHEQHQETDSSSHTSHLLGFCSLLRLRSCLDSCPLREFPADQSLETSEISRSAYVLSRALADPHTQA